MLKERKGKRGRLGHEGRFLKINKAAEFQGITIASFKLKEIRKKRKGMR